MYHSWTQAIALLPVRAIPRTFEDLGSLISRAAEQMGYKNPIWILRPEVISYSVQAFSLGLLRKRMDYQFFEQLLGLDEEALYRLTLHRFASRVQAPELSRSTNAEMIQRPLLTRYLFQSLFHPYSATKVCPRCLAVSLRSQPMGASSGMPCLLSSASGIRSSYSTDARPAVTRFPSYAPPSHTVRTVAAAITESPRSSLCQMIHSFI